MALLVDSHCHLHDSEFYADNREKIYGQCASELAAMICVGTDVRSSREAVEFCATHAKCFPVVGIHPHDSKDNDVAEIRELIEKHRDEIVGIGEIGLDYYYDHSPRERQAEVLREQLVLAREFNLPVSFHVREAFDDFWPIIDEFPEVCGVIHSFTDTRENYKEAVKRGFFIGINGVSTFTKDEEQQQLYAEIALEEIVLETDAPFLTPKPFRGKMNIPAYVGRVAEHQAMQKDVSPEVVMRITTQNAEKVFGKLCQEIHQ